MEPTNAVVFRDVSVRRSGLAILEHVNATVPQGSCTVIVGPNGAGKTTLILALIGEMRHDGDIDVMTDGAENPCGSAMCRNASALIGGCRSRSWNSSSWASRSARSGSASGPR